MRVILIAVGRLKGGPERDLFARYFDRAAAVGRGIGLTSFELREIDESRARRALDRKAEEAAAIRSAIPSAARSMFLDQRGKMLSSPEFAASIGETRDSGCPALALVIGGADGLDPALREQVSA